MSTLNFGGAQYQAESMAVGAAIGAGMFGMVGAIASVIQAHKALAELERRMAEWDNPGLIHEPIRREFMLAKLSEAEEYLFTRLPYEIETLRKINVDLRRITAEPFTVFDQLVDRIALAGAGLTDDEKGQAFAESVEQPIPPPEAFDPATSPLHQPLEGLERMRNQHDWLTKSVRGPVYGGCYDPKSDQRDKSANAMWLEIREAKERIEAIGTSLFEENKQIAEEAQFVKENFENLIALYQIAVLAYNDQAPEEQVTTFLELFKLIQGNPNGFTEALERAGKIAASQKESANP